MSDKEAAAFITREDGSAYRDVHELQEEFMTLLSQGVEQVPMAPCDDFDPKTGCRGHAVQENSHTLQGKS